MAHVCVILPEAASRNSTSKPMTVARVFPSAVSAKPGTGDVSDHRSFPVVTSHWRSSFAAVPSRDRFRIPHQRGDRLAL